MSEMEDRMAKAIYDAMDIADGLDTTSAARYARAALEAIRQPTDTMVDKGDIWADGPGYAAKVWEAMVDDALTSPSTALPA